ncbi:MAG: branched-chain amino acid transaminase [Chloroflexota bacterium]
MTTLAYFEGEIVPYSQATVSIGCNTLHYGTGCFGGLRAFWNDDEEQLYLFRPHDHFTRLLNSARLLLCELDYTVEQLVEITIELLAREGWQQNVYIRPIVYKDDEIFRVWLHDANDKLAIFSQAIGNYIKNENALDICVSSWRRVDDTAMPARGKVNGTYVNSALVKSDAVLSGFDDAIVLNQDGHVAEASAANFMMIRDGVVITPPITSNLLEGITRRTVMQLLRDELSLEVVEREIDRSELYLAEEAFFCGTGVQIASIGTIDHRKVGDGQIGPIGGQLSALYQRVVTGRVSAYRDWLVPIPVPEFA